MIKLNNAPQTTPISKSFKNSIPKGFQKKGKHEGICSKGTTSTVVFVTAMCSLMILHAMLNSKKHDGGPPEEHAWFYHKQLVDTINAQPKATWQVY